MLFHPTYFSPIIQYIAMYHSDVLVFETQDNFEKQTYRNRCKIAGPNGIQNLTIPIIKNSGVKTPTKDILIDYKENWQTNHFRSIKTAYQSSPFFEFYEDDIRPLYENEIKYLLDFNIQCHEVFSKALDLKLNFNKTDEYNTEVVHDFRKLVNAKKEPDYKLKPYVQVFDDKYGFTPNLSILDLLFNEGPNTEIYLLDNKIELENLSQK